MAVKRPVKNQAKETDPFVFRKCVTIMKSTGKRACNLRELREVISSISTESIFHHTYQFFMKNHSMEFTNDFAQWIADYLEEKILAERLSNIDPYSFKDVNELRGSILKIIDEHLQDFPQQRGVFPGNEFYFNETATIVFPLGIKAKNLAEFLIAIRYVDGESIYYHFYEARTRLDSPYDDFSNWFEHSLNKKELAENVRSIDPFMHNIEGIRENIIEIVEMELKRDMEETL